jgi:hypothetical protein
MADEAVSSVAIEHPEWDMDEARTWNEWVADDDRVAEAAVTYRTTCTGTRHIVTADVYPGGLWSESSPYPCRTDVVDVWPCNCERRDDAPAGNIEEEP